MNHICFILKHLASLHVYVKAMSILKRMLQEVSRDGLPTSTDEPMETCKVFEFKIADWQTMSLFAILNSETVQVSMDSEEDGEDPGDEDLEQMYIVSI